MPGSTSTSGIGKFSASTTTASSVVASSSPRVNGRSARSAIFGERASPAAAPVRPGGHGSIVSGTYSPPSGASPSNSAVSNETAGADAARRYEAHDVVEARTRAPLAERWATRRSAARRRCAVLTAAVIAAATRCASASSRHSAKSDGPEPDRLQPSAPASAAACLIAARPGTSGARRGSAIVSSSDAARSARSRRGAGRRRARRDSPTAGWRRASGTVVAEQRARLRRFDLEIRVHDDRHEAGRHRQPDDVGRIGAAGRARIRRRAHGAMLSACADPAPSRSPSKRTRHQRLERGVRAEQRVDGDDRRGGAGGAAAEAARQRQALANA